MSGFSPQGRRAATLGWPTEPLRGAGRTRLAKARHEIRGEIPRAQRGHATDRRSSLTRAKRSAAARASAAAAQFNSIRLAGRRKNATCTARRTRTSDKKNVGKYREHKLETHCDTLKCQDKPWLEVHVDRIQRDEVVRRHNDAQEQNQAAAFVIVTPQVASPIPDLRHNWPRGGSDRTASDGRGQHHGQHHAGREAKGRRAGRCTRP